MTDEKTPVPLIEIKLSLPTDEAKALDLAGKILF